MKDKETEYSTYNFSATDSLKKKTIEFFFHLCYEASKKEETIADHTHETGFTTGVKLAKSMLWKYTPVEIRNIIRELNEYQKTKFEEIDTGTLTAENKLINKQKIARQVAIQILEFLLVVLQYSPMSVEYKEMEILGDFEDLINTIRNNKTVKLFSGEIDD